MYKVLIRFRDGENGKPWPLDKGGFTYAVGDTYPKEGLEPTQEHINYLSGGENKVGRPVIEAAEGKPLDKMKKAELEAVAAEKGVDISGAKNNKEIVALIEAAGGSGE